MIRAEVILPGVKFGLSASGRTWIEDVSEQEAEGLKRRTKVTGRRITMNNKELHNVYSFFLLLRIHF
jgi:hypothetical protein